MAGTLVIWLLLCGTISFCYGFYIPGVAPQSFLVGDRVPVKAVKLYSSIRQLPFEYYYAPFCPPKGNDLKYSARNFGEVLRGDRLVNTPYELAMLVESKCKILCEKEYTKESIDLFRDLIQDEYNVELVVDNLPVVSQTYVSNYVTIGYLLGYQDKTQDKMIMFNHLNFNISFHEESDGSYRIVGFHVDIQSSNYGDKLPTNTKEACPGSFPLEVPKLSESGGRFKVVYTYSVHWHNNSNLEWASRWDPYLDMKNTQVHWYSLLHSSIVIIFLTGLIGVVTVRALNRDIARYNQLDDLEEALEETGWKLVHGDVFRPPKNIVFFVSLLGAGVQILAMAVILLFVAMLGMMSPASRGSLMTGMIVLFELMGLFSGYFSGRMYRTLKGKHWKKAAFFTATIFPGVVFGIGFFLNFFIWGSDSSGALPAGTMVAFISLWLFLALPLTFLGYYFGFRKAPYNFPVRVNQIPRQVPQQPFHQHTLVTALVAGILPFFSVFIEILYIFSALWENKFYYLFGFLFVTFFILIVSTVQVSVLAVYFQLCHENYHWWWRTFLCGAGSTIYVFGYSVFFYVTRLEITDFIPTLFYFGYTLIICISFGLMTGTAGFYAAFFFNRRIFSQIRID